MYPEPWRGMLDAMSETVPGHTRSAVRVACCTGTMIVYAAKNQVICALVDLVRAGFPGRDGERDRARAGQGQLIGLFEGWCLSQPTTSGTCAAPQSDA